MRKFLSVLFIVIFVLLASTSFAQTWHTANQVTIAWDAVTQTTEGMDLPIDQISYSIYISDENSTNQVVLGETVETTYLVTLPSEGKYFVGVMCIRTVNTERVSESEITWSNEEPIPFGIQYYAAPRKSTGVRIP